MADRLLVVHVGQGHSGWLTGASISHDGSQAVTTSGDGLGLVWDLATGKQLRTLEGHSAEVSASLMTRKARCDTLDPLAQACCPLHRRSSKKRYRYRGHTVHRVCL